MRRVITVLVIFALVMLGFAGSVSAAAPQFDGEVSPKAVLLIDADSGYEMFAKNKDERVEPASTTKIMTCILALESASMDTKVTVSEKAADARGSSLDLEEDEIVEMGDLLHGMMMVSGNDAAIAVAEAISGDISKFADLMNAKAQALGMTNTHFVNPHGMHDEEHYTTAGDMAKLMQYAVKNPAFMDIIDRDSYTMPQSNKQSSKSKGNTNLLMRSDEDEYYPYATGGKTGSTEQGAKRWSTAKTLFDFGFNNFVTIDLQQLLDKAEPVKVQIDNYASTDENDGLLVFEGPQSAGTYQTIDKSIADGILDGTDRIIADEPDFTSTLQAPILKGDVLGTVTYRSEATGEPIYTGNLIATRDVLQAGAEPDASGGTAVTVVQPVNIEEIKSSDGSIFYWLIIPGALIIFLVVRLLTVTRRKRKRFSKKRPHYSYRIK